MRTCTVKISGAAPYSPCRMHTVQKRQDETYDDYESRTWREKCTTNAAGDVVIPAMAFKQALSAAAKRMGIQIPGKGRATYTKFFQSDVVCTGDVPIGVHKDEIDSITVSCHADGVRGSGKRVFRTFPQADEWSGTVEFLLVDKNIPKSVFDKVVKGAGLGVGVGRFRPENGGMNGRFRIDSVSWSED